MQGIKRSVSFQILLALKIAPFKLSFKIEFYSELAGFSASFFDEEWRQRFVRENLTIGWDFLSFTSFMPNFSHKLIYYLITNSMKIYWMSLLLFEKKLENITKSLWKWEDIWWRTFSKQNFYTFAFWKLGWLMLAMIKYLGLCCTLNILSREKF